MAVNNCSVNNIRLWILILSPAPKFIYDRNWYTHGSTLWSTRTVVATTTVESYQFSWFSSNFSIFILSSVELLIHSRRFCPATLYSLRNSHTQNNISALITPAATTKIQNMVEMACGRLDSFSSVSMKSNGSFSHPVQWKVVRFPDRKKNMNMNL